MERLVIDAMNVIGSRPTGWWRDRAGATRRLVARVEALAGTGEVGEVTLVVDGRPVDGLPEGRRGALRLLYAPRRGRNAADDRIVELVDADAEPGSLCVVTSDRQLAARVRALGASVAGAGALMRRLDALADAEEPRRGRP